MIRYFPMPYPDEALYSVVVRYGKREGNKNMQITMNELLGSGNMNIYQNFIGNLEYMCSLFRVECVYTPDYFILSRIIQYCHSINRFSPQNGMKT